jgi:hypothetical protein
MCFRARLRSKKKLERTYWTDKNLKASPKKDFSQKREILQIASPEFVLRFEIILFGSESRFEVHAACNMDPIIFVI